VSISGQAGARARRGLSLLEVLIAMSMLFVMMSAVWQISTGATDAYRDVSIAANLSTRAHQTLDRLAQELSNAGRAGLAPQFTPLFGADSLSYRRSEGYAGGVIWSDELRIELQRDPGDADDGIDNDGDGLIDEGMLAWITDPGGPEEHQVVQCHWIAEYLEGELPNGIDDNGNGLIDERGLSFELQGQILTIRLTLERAVPGGRKITKTVSTSVKVVN